MNLDRKVGMIVIEFTTAKPKNGRRGQPRIPSGTKLHAIEYSIGGYFTYSYKTRQAAETAIENMKREGTDTRRFYDFNMVRDVQNTLHVIR